MRSVSAHGQNPSGDAEAEIEVALSRQYTTAEFECEDSRTCDEGTPKTSESMTSDDFHFCQEPQNETDRKDAAAREDFAAMVKRQRAELKAEHEARQAQWVASMQTDLISHVHPTLRLPGLIAEAYAYERRLLKKKKQERRASHAPVPFARLEADLRRSYTSMLQEVNRAVRSEPPLSDLGLPAISPLVHQQQIADTGIQCFAAMLPFSDGVCGVVTELRRLTGDGLLQGASCNDLSISPQSPTSAPPRGSTIGSTGKVIPISLGAQHCKPDRVAAFRRRELARAQTPAPERAARATTPIFTTRAKPPQYRMPIGASTSSSC